MNLKWNTKPKNLDINEGTVTMTAGSNTRLFNKPDETARYNNFPYMYEEWTGDFVASCKVSLEFQKVFDQGALVVWDNELTWIKLAFENSDNGYPAIVSVVTKAYSDDCTGEKIDGDVWLRIIRKANTFALHYSKDNINWSLARICNVSMGKRVKIGVSAQCPSGDQCTVIFEDIRIEKHFYEDIRNPEILINDINE